MGYEKQTVCEKVAVLLATYNGSNFIEEQINSILKQSYSNIVIYIHDDGSTDTTVSTVQDYARRYANTFRIIDAPSCGGACQNFMFLLKFVEENYIVFADQDDIWDENKIEKMIKAMKNAEKEGEACLIFSDLKVVDKNLNIISNSFFSYSGKDSSRLQYRQLLMQNFVPGCAMMINKQAAILASYYQNINNIYMHDWWLMLVVSLKGTIAGIEESLVFYRQHGENTIGADKKVSYITVIRHIWQTVFGDHKTEILNRIDVPRKFASELVNIPGINQEDKMFLSEFSKIGNRRKIHRIAFYIRNRLFRNNHRNIFMLFFV